MFRKWLPSLLIIGCIVAPLQAQEKAAPTVLLRVKSFETLIENAKVIAKAVDQAEVGNQLDAMIKAQVGEKGLDGIDTKRAWGFYANVTPDLSDPSAVLMVPISNEKAFLEFLKNLNYPAKKDDDGVYIIDQFVAPVQIGFRIANKYAYITADNFNAIKEKNVLTPGQVFRRGDTSDISGNLRMDQIPEQFRQIAISKMEEELAKEKMKEEPGETPLERKFRQEFIDFFGQQVADFLRGGKDVGIAFDINPKTEIVTLETSLSGKKTSRLAANISSMAETKSIFGGLSKESSLSSISNFKIPSSIQKVLDPMITEGMKKALEKENDPAKREQLETVLKAIEPTLRAGIVNGAAVINAHDDGQATLVIGVRVTNGKKIESAVKKVVKSLPAKEREKLKIDAEKIGDVNVHVLEVAEGYDAQAKKLFGTTPAYLAFKPNAMMMTLGKDAKAALASALEAKANAGPVFQVEMNMMQLAALAAKSKSEKEIAKKIFSEKSPGVIRMTVEGGPMMRVRFSADLSVLRFGVEMNKLRQEIGVRDNEVSAPAIIR